MSRNLYNNPDIKKLISATENQNFERKSTLIQERDLALEFSAFANSSVEGGLVVVGIENDKNITGINFTGQEKINKLIQAQRTFCPMAIMNYKEFSVMNNKGENDRLLLFYVEFSFDKVIKINSGDACERIGDQTCRMSPEKIRQMEYDKREAEFEKELISTLKIEQLNKDLTEEFIKKWVERDGLTNKPSTEDLILMKGFGQKEQDSIKINYAGALLFHDHPDQFIPGAKIRFLKYDGINIETGTRSNIIKDKYFEGPIDKQIERLAEMIRMQIRELSFLGDDGKFKTVLEYPEFAWYEAVVNAAVHRAYSLKNANIFVRMFDNRIEVESPGNLPGIVTVENIYKENFPRNPTLMQGLLYLGYVKYASEGVDRMRDEMIKFNLPEPEFQDDRNAVLFKVILKNNIEKKIVKSELEKMEELNQEILQELKDNEKKVIYYLVKNKKGKISDFQEELNLSRSSTIDYVRSLEAKKLIKRSQKLGPNVKYSLTEVVLKAPIGKSQEREMPQKRLF
ncbi:putative DNA binding domain-containing protein [Patescibacteria group bacterium]|nr:putative DNA binding domain-containing protein [Patescibacteria group bacterium]